MNEKNDRGDDYTFSVGIGSLVMSNELARIEKDEERKKKKARVVRKKFQMLKETFPRRRFTDITQASHRLSTLLKKDEKTSLLIDLAFTNPLAPYELKFKKEELNQSLIRVGQVIGIDENAVNRILETKNDAIKSHRNINWAKFAVYGAAAAVVMGAGGYAAAPWFGAALGSAAGLSGAAATAHGLALLGGGSLAMGGAGMAGGMWLVAGAGAALGAGGTILTQIGAAAAKNELAKLQVSYREMVIGNQIEQRKAQEVIKKIVQTQGRVEKELEEERMLNDKNSDRIKEMEETIEAIENSIKWMEKKRA
jgi:hypothetical protein